MVTFTLVQGDVFPRLRATLTTVSGAPVDLTTAVSVTFILRDRSRVEPVVEREAEIIDAESGKVAFSFEEGETDSSGEYLGQFEVEYPNGVQTFPTEGYIMVTIRPALDSNEAEAFMTVREVFTKTGVDVTTRDIAVAMTMIGDLVSLDLYDPSPELAEADARNLRAAVAYQAAWIVSQPDLFARLDLASINMPGLAMNPSDENSWLLAPMARRLLRKLSWAKSGGGNGTLIPRPFMDRFVDRPAVYTEVDAFGPRPIVRPPLPEDYYWVEVS